MSEQQHRSSPTILESRTLEKDHRRLAEILRAGDRVLDVGCGSGAITRGIARAVQPLGYAVGLDRDEVLIQRAREQSEGLPGLEFRVGNVLELGERDRYDVATAARALQWISDVPAALENMIAAVRPGGSIVVLDYDHAELQWRPEPPASVRRFYDRFLAWREANGWDNRMATHCPAYFERAGLKDVVSTPQNEVARRGEPGFQDALRIWAIVMEEDHIGSTDRGTLDELLDEYAAWCHERAELQCMVLGATCGRRPR